MWRDFSGWEDFPVVSATPRPIHYTNRFEAAVNWYAERAVTGIMATAPYFYLVLFLAYLAVCAGIIS